MSQHVLWQFATVCMRPMPMTGASWRLGVVIRRSAQLGQEWTDVERERLGDTLADIIPSTPVWVVNDQVPGYYGVITIRLKNPPSDDIQGWIRRDHIMALPRPDQPLSDLVFAFCRDCTRSQCGFCGHDLPHVAPGRGEKYPGWTAVSKILSGIHAMISGKTRSWIGSATSTRRTS